MFEWAGGTRRFGLVLTHSIEGIHRSDSSDDVDASVVVEDEVDD